MGISNERKINKKLGQLLLERGIISKDMLVEALKKQNAQGGSLGAYLAEQGLVSEKDIVQCISSQYGLPYLDLTNYKIERDVINLIPASVAEKYRCIPVDQGEGVITVAMANPTDEEAVSSIELITNRKAQIFVTTISDINFALEKYYEVCMVDNIIQKDDENQIKVDDYAGPERRRYIRFKANIEAHYAFQNKYTKKYIKDVSAGGLSFFSENHIPLNAYLTLEIRLPSEVLERPIAAVVKVVRVRGFKDKKLYEIGVELIQITAEDKRTIIKYAKVATDETVKDA
ncbi:PilZ domain-containing protein [Candidatus Omnitrophota bacterium]